MKQKMACLRVTPLWAHRVQASPFTHPSPRARDESPSSTAPTRTTTCRQRRSHVTPPSPAKGETQKQRVRGKEHVCVHLNDVSIKKASYLLCFLSFLSNCPFPPQAHSRRLYCHTFCSSELNFIGYSFICTKTIIMILILLPVLMFIFVHQL